jgi:hypothetical protein
MPQAFVGMRWSPGHRRRVRAASASAECPFHERRVLALGRRDHGCGLGQVASVQPIECAGYPAVLIPACPGIQWRSLPLYTSEAIGSPDIPIASGEPRGRGKSRMAATPSQ